MTMGVCYTNQPEQQAPRSLQELIDFVGLIASKPDQMFVQISGYGVDVVQALAVHLGTNFFDWKDTKGVDLNPFTTIYIDREGKIQRFGINERSKIIVYAKRPIYHSVSRTDS